MPDLPHFMLGRLVPPHRVLPKHTSSLQLPNGTGHLLKMFVHGCCEELTFGCRCWFPPTPRALQARVHERCRQRRSAGLLAWEPIVYIDAAPGCFHCIARADCSVWTASDLCNPTATSWACYKLGLLLTLPLSSIRDFSNWMKHCNRWHCPCCFCPEERSLGFICLVLSEIRQGVRLVQLHS